jgi:hypothetical protein
VLTEPKKESGIDLEAWGPAKTTWTARRGEEFDYVVWAIPPSMITLIGDERMKRTWKNVWEKLPTTATQAAQIWLTKDTKDLGWPREGLKPAATVRYASASFPHPLNGCVAFDDVIQQEAWGRDGPKGLFYLCGQIQNLVGDTHSEARIRVRSTASASLHGIGNFLVKGRARLPDRPDEQALDFDLLYDPGRDHTGEERLVHQYFRANVEPHQAYVQAPPTSIGGRLDTWDSRYGNLVIAGDWVRTGFNLGSFESAVTGGKLAAFALVGAPVIDSVVGYRFLHGKAGARIEAALKRGPRIPT